MPIFLDEDEYDEDKPEALYDLPDDLKDEKTKSQIEFKKEIEEASSYTATYKE